MKIAIDGTSASGKGTLGKKLSKKLGFDYLDTGKLFRMLALETVKRKIDINFITNEEIKNIVDNIKLENLSEKKLGNPDISETASKLATIDAVRKQLLSLQRNFARFPPSSKGVILDGRDIGSKVLPNADIKFFIDAKLSIRAQRRQKEYQNSGITINYEDILKDLKKRDYRDKNRLISPLIMTKDAFFIDSSHKNADEVLQVALGYLRKFNICYKTSSE